MNNRVVNKQIPLKSIIQIANHLEEYKEKYDEIPKIIRGKITKEEKWKLELKRRVKIH